MKGNPVEPARPIPVGVLCDKERGLLILRQDGNAIESARRSLALAPYHDPYVSLILISASALNGQQTQAGEVLKAYLADGRARSKTIAQFQTQQLALANSAGWVNYNERFAEGLRKAGFPE
ncbi:hypothetical protein [Bradyrhizobium centrosematis]|uniref:hypothetical protein n=1 Tax=Bradyrhizobium centrosematis TaxID=1300039 RepID=UPI0021692B61|nr:hypothetical protein [Bradyrhizobium centrosematis]